MTKNDTELEKEYLFITDQFLGMCEKFAERECNEEYVTVALVDMVHQMCFELAPNQDVATLIIVSSLNRCLEGKVPSHNFVSH